ncbi:unnamed protein product [Effrenium voratum]|nr:unnamed protein product [Effrenium voratum]
MARQGVLALAAAFAVLAPSAFLVPAAQNAPRQLAPHNSARVEAATASEREAPEPLGKFSGSSVALILAAAVVARNVAMYGASPKGKRAHWRTQRDKVRWYRRGENAAKRALALGRGIRDGTVDFIYGQVEEQEDDDDYDDECGKIGSPEACECLLATGRRLQDPDTSIERQVQTFTDPMNPFARNTSKAMTNLQEARADPARAGARTRNPGMIPAAEGSDRLGFSVYRYGHHVYRPQKRISDVFPGSPSSTMVTPAPSPRNVPSPRSSQGATEALRSGKPITATTALENYLNDMKRCSTSLRNVPPTPSADLQRMNNELTFLPSERGKGDALKRRSRSLSVDRSMHEESSSSDAYGFARKRPVSGALGAANRSHRWGNFDIDWDMETFRYTSMCRFHLAGRCERGEDCFFAHEESQLREKPDLYRTRICRSYAKTGKCKARDR